MSSLDPVALQGSGKKRKINTTQYIPRTSKEAQDHADAARILNILFEPVYKWIKALVNF